MRYHYEHAIVKDNVRGARWRHESLANVLIREIFNDYRQAKIQLSHPAITNPIYITLDALREHLPLPNMTLDQWFESIGDASLDTVDGVVEINTVTVDQRDVWLAGFHVKPIRIGTHPDNDTPKNTRPDLLLTKDGMDYYQLYKHALVSVNGFIHRTGYSTYGLHVKDGAKTGFQMNDTQIGITSFDGVGEIEIVDLNEDMLYRPSPSTRHYEYAHLDLGVSTENRSVILVLAGYPHVLDSTYLEMGDGLIQIDFNNYPMIQRYYDAKDTMDLSSLPYHLVTPNTDQRKVSELLQSEEWIKAYLNLAHSFAVIVDTPDLYVSKHKLEDTRLPGKFIAHQQPHWPLKSLRGRWLPYVAQRQDGVYLISCQNNLLPNYQFEHTEYRNLHSVTNQKMPMKPYYRDRGFLLEIGRDQ